jgi:hypothetical protein
MSVISLAMGQAIIAQITAHRVGRRHSIQITMASSAIRTGHHLFPSLTVRKNGSSPSGQPLMK